MCINIKYRFVLPSLENLDLYTCQINASTIYLATFYCIKQHKEAVLHSQVPMRVQGRYRHVNNTLADFSETLPACLSGGQEGIEKSGQQTRLLWAQYLTGMVSLERGLKFEGTERVDRFIIVCLYEMRE